MARTQQDKSAGVTNGVTSKSWGPRGRRDLAKTQREADEIPTTVSSRTRAEPSDDAVSQHEFPETRDGKVTYISRMMAANLYRSGRTPLELAVRWRMNHFAVMHIAVEASRITRLSIHADELARGVAESIAELRELAATCRDNGEMREAIVATKAAGDLCTTLLHNASELFGAGKSLTPTAATQALIEAGWTPPNTLVGLPAPDWNPSPPAVLDAEHFTDDANNDSDCNADKNKGHD